MREKIIVEFTNLDVSNQMKHILRKEKKGICRICTNKAEINKLCKICYEEQLVRQKVSSLNYYYIQKGKAGKNET